MEHIITSPLMQTAILEAIDFYESRDLNAEMSEFFDIRIGDIVEAMMISNL